MPNHPDSDWLGAGIKRCVPLATPWNGSAFRFTTVKYSNRRDLLSGAGARIHGGRWNPPGGFNCVYGSLTAGVAQEESFASYDRYGISRSQMRPMVQVAILLRLQVVMALTLPAVLKSIGTTTAELITCDWEAAQDQGVEALTQAIGRLAWEERLEAIIVPSRQVSGASNLILFPGRRRPGSSWKIQGARDLPKRSDR